MTQSNGKFDLPNIRRELQQIIINVMSDGDLHSIPDDIPILDLGISSLALVEGMRQVYDRFGVLVSIRRVIEGQITIGTLALYIEQEFNSQQSLKKRALSTPTSWVVERQIPLAPSQQHLGFLSRYSSEAGAAFNEALILKLDGALHGPALHAAVEEVANRYESLRTTLNANQNTLDVGSGEPLELAVSPVAPQELKARLAEICARPFEIGRRLFRAELLRHSETEHVLVLVGHTLVVEQHALGIILNDIAQLYQVFSHDQEAGLAPLTLQWTDYLALSDTNEAKEAQRIAEEYWKDVYASGVPRLELPVDYPRPPIKKYRGSRVGLKIDSAIDERLNAFAVSEGVSSQTVLFAAFTIFLHRLSNLDDLIVGLESENLYLDGNTAAIANTHNILPVRAVFDAKRSFKEYIHLEADALAKANLQRSLSLAELIQLLQLPRDQSRSPLFTASFCLQKEESAPVFDGLQSTFILPPSAGARYDIELIVFHQGDGISLVCDYSAELFQAETVSRWLSGIIAVLDSGLQEPGQACGLLPMMSSNEREMILSTWNKTEKPFPPAQTVLELITEQARAAHEALAIRFGNASLSYGQLMERVEHIASALHQHGVKHGDRVGILMQRSLDLIPAMIAVWRIGALYVPVDIGFPKKRISYMLTDANINLVIVNRELLNLLDEEHASNALCIEDVYEQISLSDEVSSARGVDSAYIIYTSGSTGKPKGVEISHGSLLNCMLALKDYQEFSSDNSMLALTTISFDVSTNELFMPLISGGCVDLAEDGLVADGLKIVEYIENRKPSHIQLTASIWKSVLTAGWLGDKDICLASCGEAISRDLAEQLLDRCRVLWNFYGPTETTVYSTAYQIESEFGKPMRVGHPLPNTQIYILDKQFQPVPIGVVGDLYIAGNGLAIGYWQRPELTNERFVPNPFREGTRMYWAGDLARYLADGSIICLGRLDDQVKIHGVRVELGEVESALRSTEGVRDAVAVSWKDSRGDIQLVAHVITEKEVTTSELRSRLRERLPEVMIPPYILFTDSFPQTANGKVHRTALPSPDGANQNLAKKKIIEPPSTTTEKTAAGIWSNILGIDESIIGRDSDFMDLGGHSLLMTLLMIEVRKVFQVNFNLHEFFAASTLRKFSALIDERQQQESDNSSLGRSAASVRSPEWARQRMAFLQREAELPRYIAPARGLTYQPVDEIKSALLTGATGFLGAYIIAEILKTTQAEIYCLVRPRRGENSKERIEKQMKRYQVWAESDAELEVWQSAWDTRLHIVDGDVTLPRLGMKDMEYETLARHVDAIFHGAAHVNFIYPYEALRATNVLGIHEIIQFAFHSRIKPVHHLSTAAIWPMGAQYTYYEKDPIDHVGVLNLGYDEAKWVGEKCMVHAAERGLPVARYRPGEVGGDSITGRCVPDHFIIACFKGFLQFGVFPDLDIEVDVAPVDYVAKAMVHLAFHRNVLGRALHLTNPSRRRLKDGMTYLRSLGYQFEELPFVDLRDRLVNSPDFSSNALFAYQAALDEMDNVSMQLPTYDTRETERELAGSGITCPPADEKLFGTYLRYLQEIGFIPQPENLQASR